MRISTGGIVLILATVLALAAAVGLVLVLIPGGVGS
jgi:hypothetical protein